MRKTGLMLVSLILVSSMIGCGNDSKDRIDNADITNKEVSTTETSVINESTVEDKDNNIQVLSEELLRKFDSRNTYVHDDVNVELLEYDDLGNIVSITPLIWYMEDIDFKNKRVNTKVLDAEEYNTLSEHWYDATRDYYSQRYNDQGSLAHENENISMPDNIYDYLIKSIPVLKNGYGEEDMETEEYDSLVSYWFTFYSDAVPSDVSCIDSYDSLGETYTDVDINFSKSDTGDTMEVDIDTEFYSNNVRYKLSTEHLLLFSDKELEDDDWYGRQR